MLNLIRVHLESSTPNTHSLEQEPVAPAAELLNRHSQQQQPPELVLEKVEKEKKSELNVDEGNERDNKLKMRVHTQTPPFSRQTPPFTPPFCTLSGTTMCHMNDVKIAATSHTNALWVMKMGK